MTDLPFRIGQAVDVHAFAAPDSPRPLMVACLEWPGERPLEGHSDADVAAHALCDAMLLATGLGELGTVFGVDRPEWAGASGRALLQEVRRMTAEAGWVLGNATVQVVGNRPRMAARLPEACATMSEIAEARAWPRWPAPSWCAPRGNPRAPPGAQRGRNVS